MKKKLAGLALLAVLIPASGTVLASDATYQDSGNSASVSGAGSFSTVLINKVDVGSENAEATAANTVYLDQAADAKSGAVAFSLKANPDPGKYRVRLGSESGNAQELYFYVGLPAPKATDSAMTRLGEEKQADDTYNVGYILTVDLSEISNYKSVKIGTDSENHSYGGYAFSEKNWTDLSGSGSAQLIFQINNVPPEYKDTISVYLSNDTVSAEKVASSQGGE